MKNHLPRKSISFVLEGPTQKIDIICFYSGNYKVKTQEDKKKIDLKEKKKPFDL